MSRRETPKWTGWIEFGKNVIQLLLGFIQLFPFVSAAAGIILAYFSIIQWAIIFLGMSLVFFGVAFFSKNLLQVRKIAFTNPSLWIERDEVYIQVYSDRRIVERRYQFKALKRVERYRFKFRWSGSDSVKMTLMGSDDALIRITSPTRVHWGWNRYEVRFQEVMRAGDKKTVIIHYELPDKQSQSEPYHLVSYGHVAGCSKLVFRLSFPESTGTRDVYLIQYDSDWAVQKGLPIGRDNDDNEYRIEVEPETGIKYSLEWQKT